MDTTYHLKNTTKKQFCIIILSIIMGWILLTLAYSLPTERISKNLESSVRYFKETYPQFTKYDSSKLDLYTDALMLLTSAHKNTEAVYIESLLNKQIYYDGKNPVQTLNKAYTKKQNLENDIDNAKTFSYARYWHGYASILKPLLSYPSLHYGKIRSLNMVVQLGLFSLLCIGLIKLNKPSLIPIFIACWIFMNPISTLMCLQFSTCTIITFLALNFIIYYFPKHDENLQHAGYFFTIIGILTSYLDLLTFPLITLGLPLLTYFCIREEKNNISILESFKKALFFCWSWCLGYGGMWAGKWVLASIITDQNVFLQAYQAIIFRTNSSYNDQDFNVFEVLIKQFYAFDLVIFISLILTIIYIFYKLLKKYKIKNFKENKISILYLSIILLPIIWYYILQNHAYIHEYFTYRNLTICLFAILLTLRSFLKIKENS